MQLRNSLTGLVVTPNQFERADSILRSISAMLSVSSRTGSRVPPPANAEMNLPSFISFLNDLLLQPLPEQQQEETATEASISSPEVTSDAAPVPKRRKRQLTEAEVKEKLLSGLQSPSSSPALRNENLFDRSVDFGQVCRNILQHERELSLGLIDQVFISEEWLWKCSSTNWQQKIALALPASVRSSVCSWEKPKSRRQKEYTSSVKSSRN